MTARSQGSVLLARTGKTQDEIAARIGVSRVAVSHWLNGNAKPGMKRRGDLCAEFEIPEDAWDEPASKPRNGASSPSTPPPSSVTRVPDGVLAKAEALEQMAHELMTKVQLDAEATPLEQARVMNAIASTLNLLAKLTGQFDIGSRLFRLPIWKRIEAALDRGLDGHPKAAAAVARELRKLDDG